MPAPDFSIKTGDTGSGIQATLENSGGTPVDLQGADVILRVAPMQGGATTFSGTATIDQVGDGTGPGGLMGQVHYDWPTAFGTAGLYVGEWSSTYISGTIQTFPNDGYFTILVTESL